MEALKTAVWPVYDAESETSAAATPRIYTRTKGDRLRIRDFEVVRGGRSMPIFRVGDYAPEDSIGAHSWWRTAVDPPDADGSFSLVYSLKDSATKTPASVASRKLPYFPDSGAVQYELIVDRGVLGKPRAQLVIWRPRTGRNSVMVWLQNFFGQLMPEGDVVERFYRPGNDDDPAVRYAQAQCSNERPLSGMSVLLQQAEHSEQTLAAPFYIALARCALTAGLRDYAQRALANWSQREKRKPDAWFGMMLEFAAMDYRHGALQRAETTLTLMRKGLPDIHKTRWRALKARVLFARGRPGEAVDVLSSFDPELDQNWAAHTAHGHFVAHMRYDLAIGVLQQGRDDEGRTILDLLGTALEHYPALRNQANLALGWELLKDEQGASAREVFSRIRLDSPQSNRAMLGYGWAMVTDAGTAQQRSTSLPGDRGYKQLSPQHREQLFEAGKLSCQDFNRLTVLPITACPTGEIYSGSRFGRDLLSKDETPGERAMAVWSTLASRDPRRPAVIEAELAIATTLVDLGDLSSAQSRLEAMLERIERVESDLEAARRQLQEGTLTDSLVSEVSDESRSEAGWAWAPAELPSEDAAVFLRDWIAGHRAVALLQLVRDSVLLQSTLAGTRMSVFSNTPSTDANVGKLRARAQMLEAASRKRFRNEAQSRLEEIQALYHQYYIAGLQLLTDLGTRELR